MCLLNLLVMQGTGRVGLPLEGSPHRFDATALTAPPRTTCLTRRTSGQLGALCMGLIWVDGRIVAIWYEAHQINGQQRSCRKLPVTHPSEVFGIKEGVD
jgi:hypothetical protein